MRLVRDSSRVRIKSTSLRVVGLLETDLWRSAGCQVGRVLINRKRVVSFAFVLSLSLSLSLSLALSLSHPVSFTISRSLPLSSPYDTAAPLTCRPLSANSIRSPFTWFRRNYSANRRCRTAVINRSINRWREASALQRDSDRFGRFRR